MKVLPVIGHHLAPGRRPDRARARDRPAAGDPCARPRRRSCTGRPTAAWPARCAPARPVRPRPGPRPAATAPAACRGCRRVSSQPVTVVVARKSGLISLSSPSVRPIMSAPGPRSGSSGTCGRSGSWSAIRVGQSVTIGPRDRSDAGDGDGSWISGMRHGSCVAHRPRSRSRTVHCPRSPRPAARDYGEPMPEVYTGATALPDVDALPRRGRRWGWPGRPTRRGAASTSSAC